MTYENDKKNIKKKKKPHYYVCTVESNDAYGAPIFLDISTKKYMIMNLEEVWLSKFRLDRK